MNTAAKPSLIARLGGFDDGRLMRVTFLALFAVSATFVLLDLRTMQQEDAARPEPVTTAPDAEPYLAPALTEGAPQPMPEEFTGNLEALREPITFDLQPDGILAATGTIDPGAAERFAGELENRGEYIKTVVLNSPGGSVQDALVMAQAIRDHKIGTRVQSGALCASSCPLVLAGGVSREAGARAVIGVHQVFTARNEVIASDKAVSNAQHTTARIGRLLNSMGIENGLWLHAMETPPDRLYYLKPDELRSLKLATKILADPKS